MAQSYSVFISAVTREFGAARDAVANALQARGIDVKVQRSFDLGDDTTLAKLHDYIRKCDRVVAIVGAYSGMFPPEGAVTEKFRDMLPEGMTRASLTQWEVIFARHYRRETFFFEAAGFEPEGPASDANDAAAQAAWRHWLFDGGIGRDRRQFRNADGLRADVMELDWPKLASPKPSNLPSSIGQLFKGRAEFLDTLRESFKHNAATAITGKAVHGLGGVGKSRTAIEYGHACHADYAATFFLIGKSESDLRDSLAALAGANILNLPEKDLPDLDARVAAVLNWLRANPDWLIIIDNVDDEAAVGAVNRFMNEVGQGAGHILVTSRVSDWGHTVEPVELDLLSIGAAKELLLASTPRRTKHADEDVALTKLANEQLGCLSLALVQAAAHIDERRIGFADYAVLFEKEAKKLLAKLGESAIRNLGYPLPVALTWQASFVQLGDVGRLLLDMLAWLSIEPIPRSLFAVWPQAETVDLEEGLAELTRYSFVHWEADNSAITVHRLVAQVTRDNLDNAGRDRALNGLFPWLYAINPQMHAGDIRCWPKLLPLLPHALLLLKRTNDCGPYLGQADLLNEYATLLNSLARYSEAEPLFRLALDIEEARHGKDHPALLMLLNNLAMLLQDTGRLDEAESLFRQGLDIGEVSSGPDDPRTAIRLNNLAGVLQDMGRLAEAEPLYRRSLEIDEANFGPDHPSVATRLNNLAGVLHATDRPADAEQLFRRALEISEASYEPDHPLIAIRLNNLAELLRETGRSTEAEPLYRRALAINEAAYGPDHPVLSIGLNNLALLLDATGRPAEAETLFRRGLLILLQASKASGFALPNVAPGLRNYANALAGAGREAEDINAALASVITEAGFDPAELWTQVFGEPYSR